jgi:hypothetical protein
VTPPSTTDSENFRSHWMENPVGPEQWYFRFLIGGDENGYYFAPQLLRATWFHVLNLRKPWHWPSYLLTRITNSHAWVERV